MRARSHVRLINMTKLIFATRPSALARWQTRWVINALQNIHRDLICEEKIITTQGDKILDKPLPEIGGKGLFTQELERELLSGALHCAVHSLKDLPVENPAGLTLGCIPLRAEVRDALISARGYTLSTLPANASIGTSSLRRSAQILSIRPDLHTESLRYHLGRGGINSFGFGWTCDGVAVVGYHAPRAGARCACGSMPRR
jgi:hydroxymethylbilane synthase